MSTTPPLSLRLASLALILVVTFGIDLPASNAESPPIQQDPSMVNVRQIDFAGIIWNVSSGGGFSGNTWTDATDSVWVDDLGRLHLTIRKINGSWKATEVTSTINAHYGPQRFQVMAVNPPTIDKLDPNVVLGLFLYKGCAQPACVRELDHEISRWSLPSSPLNAQFVVQPFDASGHRNQYPLTLGGAATTTHVIDWHDNLVSFSSFRGTNYNDPSSLLKAWTYTGSDIPIEKDNVKIIMDFWVNDLNAGKTPASNQEVIISDADIPTLCRPVADLACGGTIQGSTAGPGSRDQVNSYAISPWSEDGREMAYAFKATQDGRVTFQLSNQQTDQDLFVLDKSASSSACFSTNNNLTYGNQVASFQASANSTYFVLVDGASETGGTFNLSTDCSGAQPPPDPKKVFFYNYLPVVNR